jgi:hypothetical protein
MRECCELVLRLSNFSTLQTFRARQNRFFRTNCMPLARKRSQHPRELTQSPAGTTHISPPWQRWENVHQLQEAPERGDTSISRVDAPQSAKRLEFSTYENRACNSRGICTSIFIGLKSVWNQHLQKNFRGAPGDESKPAIQERITCSSGRAGLHFGPARHEAFILRGRTRRCMFNSFRIRTYTNGPRGATAANVMDIRSFAAKRSRRGGIAAKVGRRCRAEARRYIKSDGMV